MVEVVSAAAAAAAAKKVAETAALDIYSSGKAVAKHTVGKLRVEFGIGFSKYIERSYDKCRYVKTLLHRIDPIPIEKAYVDPTVLLKGRLIPGRNSLQNWRQQKESLLLDSAVPGSRCY